VDQTEDMVAEVVGLVDPEEEEDPQEVVAGEDSTDKMLVVIEETDLTRPV